MITKYILRIEHKKELDKDVIRNILNSLWVAIPIHKEKKDRCLENSSTNMVTKGWTGLVKQSNFNIALASRVALENERLRDIPPPRNSQNVVTKGEIDRPSSNVIIGNI